MRILPTIHPYTDFVVDKDAPIQPSVFDPIFSIAKRAFQKTFFGDIKIGIADFRRYTETNDGEGQRRAVACIAQKASLGYGNVLFGIQGIALLLQPPAGTDLILERVMSSFYGIGSLIGMGIGALGVYRSLKFRVRLQQRSTDEEKLAFLRDKGADYVARRASKKVAEQLLSGVLIPFLINNFEFSRVGSATNFSSSLVPCPLAMVARSRQKICAASLPNSKLFMRNGIISEVFQANAKNIAIHALGFIASALFFAPVLVMNLASSGLVTSILFFISFLINVTIYLLNNRI